MGLLGPLVVVDRDGRVLLCGSFSKTLAPGWRDMRGMYVTPGGEDEPATITWLDSKRVYTSVLEAIHRAVGTSLLVITLVSASGVASHLLAGREIPFDTTLYFVIGGVVGGITESDANLALVHRRWGDGQRAMQHEELARRRASLSPCATIAAPHDQLLAAAGRSAARCRRARPAGCSPR